MSENDDKRRVPDLLVEKLSAGDLSDDEARAVRARLEAEDGGLARLDALRRSNEEVLAQYPAAQMAKEIEDRLRVTSAAERPSSTKAAWWIGLPAVAAAAALLLVVGLPRAPTTASGTGDEVILTKGAEPRLRVFHRTVDGARALEPGDVVAAGDVLQLAYVAGGARYGVIVSIDGRGAVTLHLPSTPGEAVALDPGGLVRHDSAFELDDAPGFERFLFVTADAPFSSSLVEDAARALAASGGHAQGALGLPEGFGQVSVLVQKDAGARGR